MEDLLQESFGFEPVSIKQLAGYDNQNYLIDTGQSRYIFKTYKTDPELLSLLEAENQALLFLNDPAKYPLPIAFLDGSFVKIVSIDGVPMYCRMLSFLDGDFFGDHELTVEMCASLGAFLAELDMKLYEFHSPVISSRDWEWNLTCFELNRDYLSDITDPSQQKLVSYYFQQYDIFVRPALSKLPKQIIHNDANEWNLLLENGEVNGIIDFGDLAYGERINEVAIALTYICYRSYDPLKHAEAFIKSYHQHNPITKEEVAVLYYLIAARLCTSVCNSAHARKANPENTYAFSSEEKAWNFIHQWLKTGPIQCEKIFQKAIGYDSEKHEEISKKIDRRNRSIPSILSVSYSEPIFMQRAAFQYMYDGYGNSFLDAYNNIPHVGHSHPQVVEAGQRQLASLNTNTRYVYDQLAEYAEKLLVKFPPFLSKVFFVNSGSAASDLAIRLAKNHTDRNGIAVMEHGYHGNTQIGIDISDYKFSNEHGQGQKEHIVKVPIPNSYNGAYQDLNAGQQFAMDAIKEIQNSCQELAAFIAEPIVGCGGQVPLADGYLEALYPELRKSGVLCISDEVQTGFGRLGDVFWGFEAQKVVPDIVVLGKPMGNGHPMGAVITTNAIANSFSKGVEFFSSFGGNPVSCEIGSAVLDVIAEEGLQENAKNVGDHYKGLFKELQKEFPCIGDVRGSGLFLGIELVDSKGNPNTKFAQFIKNKLRERHILISTDGPYDSVLKTKPPLCFTKSNAQQVVDEVRSVLSLQNGN